MRLTRQGMAIVALLVLPVCSGGANSRSSSVPTEMGPTTQVAVDLCGPVILAQQLKKVGPDQFSSATGEVASEAISTAEIATNEEDRVLLNQLSAAAAKVQTDYDAGMAASNYTKLLGEIRSLNTLADTLSNSFGC